MGRSHTPWTMDEPVEQISGRFVLLLEGALTLFIIGCAVAAQDPVIRAVCILWAVLMVGVMGLSRWLIRNYRIVMDEKGVRMGKRHALEWTQIHTAAVIQRGDPRWRHYSSRRGDWHFILLSVQMPEKAIDKWNFRLEAAKPGRDVRIPYTYERRRAVEHYLNKTLPDIRL